MRKRERDRMTETQKDILRMRNSRFFNFFTSFVESRIGVVLNPSARYKINICHFMPHLEGVLTSCLYESALVNPGEAVTKASKTRDCFLVKKFNRSFS